MDNFALNINKNEVAQRRLDRLVSHLADDDSQIKSGAAEAQQLSGKGVTHGTRLLHGNRPGFSPGAPDAKDTGSSPVEGSNADSAGESPAEAVKVVREEKNTSAGKMNRRESFKKVAKVNDVKEDQRGRAQSNRKVGNVKNVNNNNTANNNTVKNNNHIQHNPQMRDTQQVEQGEKKKRRKRNNRRAQSPVQGRPPSPANFDSDAVWENRDRRTQLKGPSGEFNFNHILIPQSDDDEKEEEEVKIVIEEAPLPAGGAEVEAKSVKTPPRNRRGKRGGNRSRPRQEKDAQNIANAVKDERAKELAVVDVEREKSNEKADARKEEKEAVAKEKARQGNWWCEANINEEDIDFRNAKLAALSRFDQGQVKQFIQLTSTRHDVQQWSNSDLLSKITLSRVLSQRIADPMSTLTPLRGGLGLVGGACGAIAGALVANTVRRGLIPTVLAGTLYGCSKAIKWFTPQDFVTERKRWIPVGPDFDLDQLRAQYACSTLFQRTYVDDRLRARELADKLRSLEMYAPHIVPSEICHGVLDSTMPLRRPFIAKQRYISFVEESYVNTATHYTTVNILTVEVHDVDMMLVFDCLKPKLVQCRTDADVRAAVKSLIAANIHSGPNKISNWVDESPVVCGTTAFLKELALVNILPEEPASLN